MDAEKRARLMKVVMILGPLLLVLGLALPFLMFHLVSPPAKGPPLAVLDLRSGEPFELPFVATGKEPRVFLDLQCESCSFPVTGELAFQAGDRVLHKNRISAGDLRDRAWGGHDRKLDQHLIFGGPEPPAGTRVVLKGTLLVGPARGGLSNAPLKDAPPTRVRVLRVTVAD